MMDLFGYLPYSGNAQRRAERKRHIPRCHMTAGPDQEDFLGIGGGKSHGKDSGFNRLGVGAIVPSLGALLNSSASLSLRSTK